MTTRTTQLKLNTNATIPAIGFGTWQDPEAQEAAVTEALKAGYRHIDTARMQVPPHSYGTEPAVGKAIKKSGVPREQIFITTKLWNNSHHPDDVEAACNASLKDLGTDYLDLYLMHWPSAFERGDTMMPKGGDGKMKTADIDYIDTYKAMEKLQKSGKTKAIGISNFSRGEVQRLLQRTSIVPAAHQFELHPYLQQKDFVAFHKQHGIHVTAYSPFGNQNEIYDSNLGKLIEDPVLVEIGKQHNKNGAQVALAWGVNRGHSVIPKSKTPERIQDNLDSDFELSAEEMEKIASIEKKVRFNDPSGTFGHDYYSDLEGKK
ncbi:MAG: hypothetical protein M1817_001713 [Caeruleum heppii]|nr:MAG: hypothetical protein M1817_001713 [Caeruleum heppii]